MGLLAKLIKWLIFSVALALLPLAFNYLHLLSHTKVPTLEALLGQGELLLIAAGISAAAIGSLIGSGTDWFLAKILAGGGSVFVLGLASLYYADVSAVHSDAQLDLHVVVTSSAWFFRFAVAAGAACVAMEEA